MKGSKVVLALGFATMLWFVATQLSEYTRGGYIRSQGHPTTTKRGADETKREDSAVAKEALALLESSSVTVEQLVKAANDVISEAEEAGDVDLLLRGLSLYSRALEIDANSEEAILGLADVSFKAGAFDKAHEYYSRYSKLKPSDLRSKTNSALALTQLGQAGEAVKLLEEARGAAPHSFQVLLTLALAHRENGDLANAQKVAKDALPLAPDAQGRSLLAAFLEGSEETTVASAESQEVGAAASVQKEDYKSIAEGFFTNHPILSPKLAGFTWKEKELTVGLNNFPIEQMPPFAKASLEAKLKQLALDKQLEFVLSDAASGKELMRVVGSK